MSAYHQAVPSKAYPPILIANTRRLTWRCGVASLSALSLAVLIAGYPSPLLAQDYPSRPIRILAPFEPGGTADVLTRIIGSLVAQDLGQPVLVENKPGAGGILGTHAAVRAKPDGYTLVVGSDALATQTFGSIRLPYDAATDLSPVTSFATIPYFVLVNAAAPAKTLRELILSARQSPELLTYASPGSGTTPHVTGARFAAAVGTKLLHVPYRGTGPAINDLIAGYVDMMFTSLPTTAMYLKSARLKALAVAAPARVPLLPDVPTVAEAGGPDFRVSAWFGLLAPRGTAMSVRMRLADSVHKALRSPEVRWRFAALGALPWEETVEGFESSFAAEIEDYRQLSEARPGLLD